MRVFAQQAELAIDLPALLSATRRFFEATLDVQSRSDTGDQIEVLLKCEERAYEGRLQIRSRRVLEADLADARLAEERGRSAGMAGLAQRCQIVWEIQSVGESSPIALLNLCAILASVGLGPVLPDDLSSLYGVRGSMERVERLLRER